MSDAARLVVGPIDSRETFKDKAYAAWRNVLESSYICRSRTDILLRGRQLAKNLFTSMRMIRGKTIGEEDRVERSIQDHMNIIKALEARDTERAEDLVRQHALGLAEHVAKHVDYLD